MQGSTSVSKQVEKEKQWLAHSDRYCPVYEIAAKADEKFESLVKLNALCEERAVTTVEDYNSLSKYCFNISPITYPTQVSVCPTVDTIKDRLFLDNLIVSVHAVDGYEFSSEYTNVYKSVHNKLTVYDDLSAVIRRALKIFDPNLMEVFCLKYAEYIIRTAAWESQLAYLVAAETVKTCVSGVDVPNKWKDTTFSHVKVFIGVRPSGELYCTMRLQVELEASDAPPKTDEEDKKKKAGKPVAVPMEFVYYREFRLNKAALDEFEQLTFVNPKSSGKKGETKAPPPPPSRAKKGAGGETQDDIVLLLVKGKSAAEIQALIAARAAEQEAAKKVAEVAAAAVVAKEPVEGDAKETVDDDAEDSVREGRAKRRELREARSKLAAEVGVVNDSSYCSEVVIWGFNSCNSFGMPYVEGSAAASGPPAAGTAGAAAGTQSDAAEAAKAKYEALEKTIDPQPISVPYSLAIERISMIACSSNHTLVLTHLGAVYGCGDNSEGALGLGDYFSRDSLTLIDWPASASASPPKITKISAGCSNIGAHSMAISVEGALYGWGVAYAVGKGIVKPVTSPAVIDLVPGASAAAVGTDAESATEDEAPVRAAGGRVDHRVVDVCCGGGFTVCVTRSGHVYSWGTWAHGRLGLGAIPMIEQPRTARKRATKKLARYQLHPRLVGHIHTAVKVVCGEAHTLCLLSCGSLLSWGQNTCGQLGVGPSYSGYLSDAFTPLLVAPFVNHARIEAEYLQLFSIRGANHVYAAALERSKGEETLVNDIACGAFHSVARTKGGEVLSWGGRGSPCLGHNDFEVVGEWNSKINLLFSIATSEARIMVPWELLDWTLTWSMPRVIESLSGITVTQLACGDLHSSFLSSSGRVYLCGSGPVVPGIISTSRVLEDNEQRELQQSLVDLALKEKQQQDGDKGATTPSKDSSKLLKSVRLAEQQARLASMVGSPRCPSSCWLAEICTRQVAYIASGACKMFTVVDAESVSFSLTSTLLDRLNNGAAATEKESLLEEYSITSAMSESGSRIESIFESRGKADCMILASGKMFLCHKALLAQRSPELRDMIAMETPLDGTFQPVQILLPELQKDSARALLHFLYTDSLPKWCIHNTSLLRSVLRAAQNLRIPRLQLLCERFVKLINATTKVGKEEVGDLSQLMSEISHTSQLDMPPLTLARDLGSMVGDPEFADVRFIAEGRAIVAHRFILESRCGYFRAMFRSGMNDGSEGSRTGMVDVVVPDSFIGFLRLLLFIYTDTLPDGSDGALLEDLMAADRYDVPDMKVLCENMLVPSQSNWLDLLRAADLLGSRRLHLLVTSYVRDNLAQLSESEGALAGKEGSEAEEKSVRDLRAEFSEVYGELVQARRGTRPAPPSEVLIGQCKANNAGNEVEKKKREAFPFWALCVAAVSLFIYQYMSKHVALGMVVPLVNFAGLAFFAIIVFKMYKSE